MSIKSVYRAIIEDMLPVLEFNEVAMRRDVGPQIVDKAISEDIFKKVYPTLKNNEQVLDFVMNTLKQADPTTNKKFVPFLIKHYLNDEFKFNQQFDALTYKLKEYDYLIANNIIKGPDKDPLRFKTIADFLKMFKKYPDKFSHETTREVKKKETKGNVEVVYESDEVLILKILDKNAACHYGRGTMWCIAATRAVNVYDTYVKQGTFYFIIPKVPINDLEKYAWQPATERIWDDDDIILKPEEAKELWEFRFIEDLTPIHDRLKKEELS